ncbi:MAG: hypothetical protein AMXMBFR84_33930 [Candidatus Hydrogenedentota bacterium]
MNEDERSADSGGTSLRLGFNMAALLISRIGGLAVTLIQLAVVFRALDLEARGQFGFALSYTSLFTMFSTFGIQRLLVRDIARDRSITWVYVWTSTAVVTLLSVLVMVGMATILAALGTDSQTQYSVFFAGLSIILLWAVQRPFESVLTAYERMGGIAVVNIASSILKLIAVYLVIPVSPTSASAHAAIAAANLISLLLCMGFAIRVAGLERPRVRMSLAIHQMKECLPFLVAMIFSQIYFKSDMTLLKFLPEESVANALTGIYTPVQRLTEPLLMISALWGTVVFPALCRFSLSPGAQFGQLKRSSARLALIVSIPMAFGLAVLGEPVMGLLIGFGAEGFQASVVCLQISCAVIPFFYLNSVGQEFLYASHRNWYVTLAYGSAALLSVGANAVAIPRYGVNGVAMVAVLVNALISCFFVAGMRHDYGAMNLGWMILKSIPASAGMIVVAFWLSPYSLVGAVLAGALLYIVLILVTKTLTREEEVIFFGVLRILALRRFRNT